ncbi:MAG TPA: HesB/YadR/YfhF-family protein [Solirubrobacteraceae bacterium]|nr:HesB/YadR/YfhF-family protein [Solirubrobacteraceae bacterium]
MLTLTPNASDAIRQLTEQLPTEEDTAGMRIAPGDAPGDEGAALELSLVEAPEQADHTVEEAGATVYLEPGAAQLLDDKVLDAEVRDDGVAFQVLDQGLGDPGMNGQAPIG